MHGCGFARRQSTADLNIPSIILGLGAAAAALGVAPSPDQLGEQGYIIRTVPPHLVIAGTPAAGTLYGVYDFLEKHLGDLNATAPRFTDRTGAEIERDMAPIIANLREGEHYLDQQAPKGAWTFTGSKGLEVTQTFDDATLDFAWAYAYPDYLNDLETELWLRRTTLAPGESITLRHAIEVRSR